VADNGINKIAVLKRKEETDESQKQLYVIKRSNIIGEEYFYNGKKRTFF
jgi:hypothetical protein